MTEIAKNPAQSAFSRMFRTNFFAVASSFISIKFNDINTIWFLHNFRILFRYDLYLSTIADYSKERIRPACPNVSNITLAEIQVCSLFRSIQLLHSITVFH